MRFDTAWLTVAGAALLGVAVGGCASASPAGGTRASSAAPQDSVCIFEGGEARLAAAGGDVRVGVSDAGRHVYPRVPPPYGDSLGWAINFTGVRLTRYGNPIVILPHEIHPVGSHAGITVFAEILATSPPYEVAFVPAAPGCRYLPYIHLEPTTGPVRPRRRR